MLHNSFSKYVISFFFIFSSISLYSISWNGQIIQSSVVDENIDISGSNTLHEAVQIKAESKDIAISVSKDSIIKGHVNNGKLPRLLLHAAENKKITFNVDNNLTFTGGDEAALFILVSGAGTIEFVLQDGKKVAFTADQPDDFGTNFFVHMDADFPPTVLFKRKTIDTKGHTEVIIGPESMMGYSAKKTVSSGLANESGVIKFDPSNTSTGRMALRIKNTGAVYIAGSYALINDQLKMSFSDIDMTQPAGFNAKFEVQNSAGSDAHSGLLIINENKKFTDLLINPWCKKDFSGKRAGFVLGANATINIKENCYLDYVGLANNFAPHPSIVENILNGRKTSSIVKKRNASAFIVDGNKDINSVPAKINLEHKSALFFRSGIDRDGLVVEGADYSFTIDDMTKTIGSGEIVFDVEGLLEVQGAGNNKIELLSNKVLASAGPVLVGGTEANFPLRNFERNNVNKLLHYNKGSFLINNRVNLRNSYLVHTDVLHRIVENNDLLSEPTYIGGDTFKIKNQSLRPKVALYNSQLMVHSSVAFTGLDLFIPNLKIGNTSSIKVFNNGYKIDDISACSMILGTQIGSFASDESTVVCYDAHLDIFQEVYQENSSDHRLDLLIGVNDQTINENISNNIHDQNSLHTLYLGHNSNISIGTPFDVVNDPQLGPSFLTTNPELNIAGNFFAFETRGGSSDNPLHATTTGSGAIFVDHKGVLKIDPSLYAHFGTMVVKNGDAIVDLPSSRAIFKKSLGIADWRLNLSDKSQRNIILDTQNISDYILNWAEVKKNYNNFTPYPTCSHKPFQAPVVEGKHINSLPVISGTVDQMHIKGSRLANIAHVMVDAGKINQLICSSGSSELPMALLAVRNDAHIGIGNLNSNFDSLYSSSVLGANGITLLADGSGVICFNNDVLVNDICTILKGPNFNSKNVLQLHSDSGAKLRIAKKGILDLSQFSDEEVISLTGNIKLLLDPGATIIFGGGRLKIAENASFIVEPVISKKIFNTAKMVIDTDEVRAKIVGSGVVEFTDSSTCLIGDGAYLGIETQSGITDKTDIVFELNRRSSFLLGDEYDISGGALQIGNTTNHTNSTVSFCLKIVGSNSKFQIGKHGFFGLGAGIVNNVDSKPNNWLVNTLFNVDTIKLDVQAGKFLHNSVAKGDSDLASLLAIGKSNTTKFLMMFDKKAMIYGGGNIAMIESDTDSVAPIVTTKNGSVSSCLDVKMFAGKYLLNKKEVMSAPALDSVFFDYISVVDSKTKNYLFANASLYDRNKLMISYVDNDTLKRVIVGEVFSNAKKSKDFRQILKKGVVRVKLFGKTSQRGLGNVSEVL